MSVHGRCLLFLWLAALLAVPAGALADSDAPVEGDVHRSVLQEAHARLGIWAQACLQQAHSREPPDAQTLERLRGHPTADLLAFLRHAQVRALRHCQGEALMDFLAVSMEVASEPGAPAEVLERVRALRDGLLVPGQLRTRLSYVRLPAPRRDALDGEGYFDTPFALSELAPLLGIVATRSLAPPPDATWRRLLAWMVDWARPGTAAAADQAFAEVTDAFSRRFDACVEESRGRPAPDEATRERLHRISPRQWRQAIPHLHARADTRCMQDAMLELYSFELELNHQASAPSHLRVRAQVGILTELMFSGRRWSDRLAYRRLPAQTRAVLDDEPYFRRPFDLTGYVHELLDLPPR